LLACDDASSAYCLILDRINFARFAYLRRAVAAVSCVENRFHCRFISYRDIRVNLLLRYPTNVYPILGRIKTATSSRHGSAQTPAARRIAAHRRGYCA
jgi:hypothetical protein